MYPQKKEIYLIRHGETEFNRLGIIQGSGVNSDLNEKGRAQALAFYEYYKHIPFKKIYTSALIRTHQTVEHFLNEGIPYEALAELNEISWGSKEGRTPNPADDEYYKKLLESWRNGETHLPAEDGESPEQVVVRQKAALEKILGREDESLILIAMHGRAMRILLAHISELPLSEMDRFEHQNVCLYKLSYNYADASFDIQLHNDIIHLETLKV